MIIVTLTAVLIILLSTVPLATGGLEFDFPDEEDDVWGMDGSRVIGTVPIGIRNGGFFDIEDFSFRLNLSDSDGYELVDVETDPVDLVAGKWTEVVVEIAFDLNDLPPEKQFEIVFNGTRASLAMGVSSYFGMRTIRTSIDIHSDEQTIEIPPMINEMSVDPSMLRLERSGEGYWLTLPYSFSASEIVSGKELYLDVSISNATKYFGEDSELVVLDQFVQGQLTFALTEEDFENLSANPDTFYVDVAITFLGITMERELTYEWTPFISNFQVQSVWAYNTGYDGQIDLSYYFDASDTIWYHNVVVHITITDEIGTVASGDDYFTVFSNNQRSAWLFVPNDVMSRVYGNEADWEMTFEIVGEDFTITKTVTYHWNGGA